MHLHDMDTDGVGRAASDDARDALLDEFDATITMFGRHMAARHGEACDHVGLSTGQMLTLRRLHEGPARVGDIARALGIKAPAASALVDSLDHAGLISREVDADDRRVTLVSVTGKGREALSNTEAQRREHMRRYLSVLPEDDIRTMIRILHTLLDAMTAEKI